jgi:hypothetical protein
MGGKFGNGLGDGTGLGRILGDGVGRGNGKICHGGLPGLVVGFPELVSPPTKLAPELPGR